MAIFPKPVSPRNAAGDLWGYLVQKRAHKWTLLGLSVAITWVIIWVFAIDTRGLGAKKQNEIIWFHNLDAAGAPSDVQIILQQKKELLEAEAHLQGEQKDMQKLADRFGIDWRADKARNDARRAEAIKAINAQLDKRLAEAMAREAAAAKAGARPDRPAAPHAGSAPTAPNTLPPSAPADTAPHAPAKPVAP